MLVVVLVVVLVAVVVRLLASFLTFTSALTGVVVIVRGTLRAHTSNRIVPGAIVISCSYHTVGGLVSGNIDLTLLVGENMRSKGYL